MLNVSQEEAAGRWDELPSNIREALLSEDNFELLEKLGITYSLSPEASQGISIAVSNVLHGLVRPQDLRKELSDIKWLDNEVAEKICLDIKTDIFDPLEPELDSIYKPPAGTVSGGGVASESKGLAYPAKPLQTTVAADAGQIHTQSEAEHPKTDNTPAQAPAEEAAPFILHQHEEEEGVQPRAEEVVNFGSPVRPMFYRAPNSTLTKETGPFYSKPVKARLELGVEEETRVRKAQPSRPPPKGVRQVNYSELRTKLDDPFSSQIKAKNSSITGTAEEQIESADLKDLPL